MPAPPLAVHIARRRLRQRLGLATAPPRPRELPAARSEVHARRDLLKWLAGDPAERATAPSVPHWLGVDLAEPGADRTIFLADDE